MTPSRHRDLAIHQHGQQPVAELGPVCSHLFMRHPTKRKPLPPSLRQPIFLQAAFRFVGESSFDACIFQQCIY